VETAEFSVRSRYFKDWHEYVHWHDIRRYGFSDWYVGRPQALSLTYNRHIANAKARLFPDYLHQVRTREGKAVAYVATVPAYWAGDIQALHNFGYYDSTFQFNNYQSFLLTVLYLTTVGFFRAPKIFDAIITQFRKHKLSGANCIVLIALTVDPDYRNMKLPSLLLSAVTETAHRLGMAYVMGPFRPSNYGTFKAKRRAAHSHLLFEEYCSLKNDEGLPIDPWLRTVARHHVEFLRLDPRSFQVPGSIEQFERFRQNYKPGHWYSPSLDVWECGETPTWYVDRCKKQVLSVEPNIWGMIRIAQ